MGSVLFTSFTRGSFRRAGRRFEKISVAAAIFQEVWLKQALRGLATVISYLRLPLRQRGHQ